LALGWEARSRTRTDAAGEQTYFPSCSAALDPERYNLANLSYEAVGDDPAGKVLVLASGAVVIPERQLEDVLAEARRIGAEDERFRADIAREESGARRRS
jgi:hypothetical protein